MAKNAKKIQCEFELDPDHKPMFERDPHAQKTARRKIRWQDVPWGSTEWPVGFRHFVPLGTADAGRSACCTYEKEHGRAFVARNGENGIVKGCWITRTK